MKLRAFGKPVKLAQEATNPPEQTGPVWIQIAREGEWSGYQGPGLSGPLKFDQKVFDGIIANFRAHPAYKAGADGKGLARVVPYDYEHASEQDPTAGSIPTTGAPAPAWVMELETRKGEGGLELWALSDLSDQAREQIRSGGYQWTSVAVWLNAVDPESGQRMGPVLTSVAFTNHPFIQGMAPMAASQRVSAKAEIWGVAESPEELVLGLRGIFGLPSTADEAAIRDQLTRLQQTAGALPGTRLAEEVERMFRRIRELLGLPTLSTTDEVIGAASSALDALSGSPTGNSVSTPTADTNPTEQTMSASLLAQLALLFRVAPSDDRALLAAAEKGAKASGLLEQIEAAFGAVDLKSFADMVKRVEKYKPIVEALQQAGNVAEPENSEQAEKAAASVRSTYQELATLREAAVVADVDVAVTLLSLSADQSATLRPLLLSERRAASGDAVKLADWQKRYPPPDPRKVQLTTTVSAQYNGGANAPVAAPVSPGGAHPLEGFSGRNRTEKCVAYLTAKRPGFAQLARADQVLEAGNYLRSGAPVL